MRKKVIVKEYVVRLTETISHSVYVTADDEDDALDQARYMLRNGEIDWGNGDSIETTIDEAELSEEREEWEEVEATPLLANDGTEINV